MLPQIDITCCPTSAAAERIEAAAHLARTLAELREFERLRKRPRNDRQIIRPRHHAFRSGEQLRPAARLREKTSAVSCRPIWPRTAMSSSFRPRPAISCGRARTASGDRAIPAGEPRSEPEPHETQLRRLFLFASRRPDAPLQETMGALATAVHGGKALYVGISSYGPNKTREAAAILRELKVPCVIHQPSYSLLNPWVEHGLLDVLEQESIGCIAFSPLAQGLLTTKYLSGIPTSSRAAQDESFRSPCSPSTISPT